MNLRTLGLRKSSPHRADHPAIGQRCVLCKCAIRAGDRTGLVPPLDSEEPALAEGLICHWTCIESGLSRLRQGETAAGGTRQFLESWADAFSRKAVARVAENGGKWQGFDYRSSAQKARKRLMVKGLRLSWIALCSKTSDTPLATSREPPQTR